MKPRTKKVNRHKPIRKWIRKTSQKGGFFFLAAIPAIISSLMAAAAAAAPAAAGALATGALGATGAFLANKARSGKGRKLQRRIVMRRR